MTTEQESLHLHVTTRMGAGESAVYVQHVVPVKPWHAGLNANEEQRETAVARQAFERLLATLMSSADWDAWRARGQAEFSWMLVRALEEGHQWLALLLNQAPTEDLKRRAAWQFNAILDAIFDRVYPLYQDGQLTPIRPTCSFIEPRAEDLRAFVASVLGEVRAPLDVWHQATALSIVLCPHLAPILVASGFWLERRSDGASVPGQR